MLVGAVPLAVAIVSFQIRATAAVDKGGVI